MTTVSGADYIHNRKRISENLKVIEDKLCRSGTITKSMAKKNCESGLNYRYLKTAHQRDITNGIRAILTEKMVNGKVRVTNRKHIINTISMVDSLDYGHYLPLAFIMNKILQPKKTSL